MDDILDRMRFYSDKKKPDPEAFHHIPVPDRKAARDDVPHAGICWSENGQLVCERFSQVEISPYKEDNDRYTKAYPDYTDVPEGGYAEATHSSGLLARMQHTLVKIECLEGERVIGKSRKVARTVVVFPTNEEAPEHPEEYVYLGQMQKKYSP